MQPIHLSASPAPKSPLSAHQRVTKALLWLGIASPVMIICLGLTAIGLASDHKLVSDTFSDLAAQDAPRANLMRFSMFIFGLSVSLFGFGLIRVYSDRNRASAYLVTGFGFAVALSGWFRDHSEVSGVPHNREGRMHNGIAILAICLIFAAMVVQLGRFTPSKDQSRDSWLISLLLLVVLVGGVVFAAGPAEMGGAAELSIYVAVLTFLVRQARTALAYASKQETGRE